MAFLESMHNSSNNNNNNNHHNSVKEMRSNLASQHEQKIPNQGIQLNATITSKVNDRLVVSSLITKTTRNKPIYVETNKKTLDIKERIVQFKKYHLVGKKFTVMLLGISFCFLFLTLPVSRS